MSAVALTAVLAACSADETDFKEAAEEAAVEGIEEADPSVTATASCEDPSSTDVGTTFSCTVTLDDGSTLPINAEIISDDTVEVTLAG